MFASWRLVTLKKGMKEAKKRKWKEMDNGDKWRVEWKKKIGRKWIDDKKEKGKEGSTSPHSDF